VERIRKTVKRGVTGETFANVNGHFTEKVFSNIDVDAE
jgi:hypothetical protein